MDKDKPNSGSPIGPGFVVYEREDGSKGYSLEMALQSVGRGWHGLIRQLFQAIEYNSEHNPSLGFGGVHLTQVKEKFGTLRLYYAGGASCPQEGCNRWSYVDGYISALEAASAHICEACGAPGELQTSRSWLLTLCPTCHGLPPENLRAILSAYPLK